MDGHILRSNHINKDAVGNSNSSNRQLMSSIGDRAVADSKICYHNHSIQSSNVTSIEAASHIANCSNTIMVQHLSTKLIRCISMSRTR